jgi:hypothetical protein
MKRPSATDSRLASSEGRRRRPNKRKNVIRITLGAKYSRMQARGAPRLPRADTSSTTIWLHVPSAVPAVGQVALGIEQGKEFQPDAATSAALRAAAQEAHAWFMDWIVTFGDHYWPEGKWDVAAPPIGPQSDFTWEADGILDVDARGIAFYSFFAPPKKARRRPVLLGRVPRRGGSAAVGR